MNKKKLIVFAVIGLMVLFSLKAWANNNEIEPNNTEDKATPVSVGTVQARVNDNQDWFKVSLPQTGPISLRLTGIPEGMSVQIGVKGLAPTGWQDGKGDTEYRFEAKSTEGLIWVLFKFYENVCGYDWCIARMVAGGPWYAVTPSANMPATYNGEPIKREAPPYKLIIEKVSGVSP